MNPKWKQPSAATATLPEVVVMEEIHEARE